MLIYEDGTLWNIILVPLTEALDGCTKWQHSFCALTVCEWVASLYMYSLEMSSLVYSGIPLMYTLLGSTQSVLNREPPLFQGLFNILKICSGLWPMSTLQWMFLFQGYIQGGVSLYIYINPFGLNFMKVCSICIVIKCGQQMFHYH